MPQTTATASAPTRPRPAALPGIIPCFPGPWSKQATCFGEDPDLFPSHGDPGSSARPVHANCPVRPECLEYAIGTDESGIWGGLDHEQRHALRDATEGPESLPAREAIRDDNRERA